MYGREWIGPNSNLTLWKKWRDEEKWKNIEGQRRIIYAFRFQLDEPHIKQME
jgi:hypothetical protein